MLQSFVLELVKALIITAVSVTGCLTIITSIWLYAMTEQPDTLIPWEASCLLIMCFFPQLCSDSDTAQDSSLLLSFSIPLPIPALRAVFLSNHQVIAFSCFLSESRQFLWMRCSHKVCWSLCPGQADHAVGCAFWWLLETSGFTEEIQTGMPLNAQMDWN